MPRNKNASMGDAVLAPPPLPLPVLHVIPRRTYILRSHCSAKGEMCGSLLLVELQRGHRCPPHAGSSPRWLSFREQKACDKLCSGHVGNLAVSIAPAAPSSWVLSWSCMAAQHSARVFESPAPLRCARYGRLWDARSQGFSGHSHCFTAAFL